MEELDDEPVLTSVEEQAAVSRILTRLPEPARGTLARSGLRGVL